MAREFKFEMSLSVLNHLGRNLYRNFNTVLGEAISNAWDADATEVRIDIDYDNDSFTIQDDGVGMDEDDFQDKFLKIGYSKRSEGEHRSPGDRPFIGRKGIGKLALLSCAERVTVISKTRDSREYVGGMIDNGGLDEAITDDLKPEEYPLEDWDEESFQEQMRGSEHGTIIRFENLKSGIRNRLEHIRKIVALSFRFSLLDKGFSIIINGEEVSLDSLKELIEKTEFLWRINDMEDPYLATLTHLKEEGKPAKMDLKVKGFIASVEKPGNLKVRGVEARVTVDLFVNGRLREADILRHISTGRVTENYFYGHIHYDALDDGEDRFATSREGIVADDPKYAEFLSRFRIKLLEIVDEWDDLRRKYKEDGDPEDERISKKARKAAELYNIVAQEYAPLPQPHGPGGPGGPDGPDGPSAGDGPGGPDEIRAWLDALQEDAEYNFGAYADCFISENLVRKFIEVRERTLDESMRDEAARQRASEVRSKREANISIGLRRDDDDRSFLSMKDLAKAADRPENTPGEPGGNNLTSDAKQYKPMRDAVMHTAVLTPEAKNRLTTVYDNIKARIRNLLSSGD